MHELLAVSLILFTICSALDKKEDALIICLLLILLVLNVCLFQFLSKSSEHIFNVG